MVRNQITEAKKSAAYAAVDEFIKDGMVVGIGSGSTVVYVAERIAQKIKMEHINIICIPTSFQSKQLIIENELPLSDLSRHFEIDVDIDGADEVDNNLNLIKGGGGCHVQEKIVASNSKTLIIVSDLSKKSKFLGEKWKKGIPIEVIPIAYMPLMEKFKDMGGKPTLRLAERKMGPLITDNGNFIIDVDFGPIQDPKSLNEKLTLIPGVVETGLFIDMASKVFFGQEDGTSIAIEK